jgi:hypothetical protein
MEEKEFASVCESYRRFVKAGHGMNHMATKRGFKYFPEPDALPFFTGEKQLYLLRAQKDGLWFNPSL